jgi:hypothetical protein
MSSIGGKKREQQGEYSKKVGLFEASVIAINPDAEEYKEILGIELKEDSKATNYLGQSDEGNTKLRIDVWLEEVKNKDKFKVSFFLENKEKANIENTKKQYINSVGSCYWAADPNELPTWFTAREYRIAFAGEEELYSFLRTWLGNLDYRDAETTLSLDWKMLMKGNVKDIKTQLNGEFCTNVVALANIKTVEKEGKVKEYQDVYNKAFLPAYSLKQFRLIDFDKPENQHPLKDKKSKELKPYERFVLNVTGEYGCKGFYIFKDIRDYNSNENLVASDAVLSDDDGPGL